ncbi:MAG: leucine-rich repeat domain-containing protein [Muribaculaceae bacterium]
MNFLSIKRLYLIAAMAAALNAGASEIVADGIVYNTLNDSTCEVGRQTPSDVPSEVRLASAVTDADGKSYMVTSVSNFAFVTCHNLNRLFIPATVQSIGNSAFSKCSGLTHVEFAGAPATVGSNCFSESDSIDTVVTPDLRSWITTSFNGSTASPLHKNATLLDGKGNAIVLRTLPEGTTTIGAYSLSGIAAEETVVFPAGLQTIGKGAFEKCNFKYVEIPSLAAWTQIDFENYTANPLYSSKVMLTVEGKEVTDLLFDSETVEIKKYAFMNYAPATEVVLPASVGTVGVQAFSGCTNLKKLTIGENVTEMGMNAFMNVDFTTIKSLAVVPPKIVRNTFSNTTCSACKLTVPSGTLDQYKNATSWKNFKDITESTPSGVEGVTTAPSDIRPVYYDLKGRPVSQPTCGVYIEVIAGQARKVVF